MGRPKKKPDYDSTKVDQSLLDKTVEIYKTVLDENEKSSSKLPADSYQLIEKAAKELEISAMKMRKLLITAGCYENDTSRLIARLSAEGKTIDEIGQAAGLRRASVNGYLPYKKVIYKNAESSVGADRIRLYRDRKNSIAKLQAEVKKITSAESFDLLDCDDNIFAEADMLLWNALEAHEGYKFTTAKGLDLKYVVKGGELFINRKENSKSLTKSSVFMAFHNGIKLQYKDGYVKGTKKLGTFGASYLYTIFMKFGIITDTHN